MNKKAVLFLFGCLSLLFSYCDSAPASSGEEVVEKAIVQGRAFWVQKGDTLNISNTTLLIRNALTNTVEIEIETTDKGEFEVEIKKRRYIVEISPKPEDNFIAFSDTIEVNEVVERYSFEATAGLPRIKVRVYEEFDGSKTYIENAKVTVDGIEIFTNSVGYFELQLAEGEYQISIESELHHLYEGILVVEGPMDIELKIQLEMDEWLSLSLGNKWEYQYLKWGDDGADDYRYEGTLTNEIISKETVADDTIFTFESRLQFSGVSNTRDGVSDTVDTEEIFLSKVSKSIDNKVDVIETENNLYPFFGFKNKFIDARDSSRNIDTLNLYTSYPKEFIEGDLLTVEDFYGSTHVKWGFQKGKGFTGYSYGSGNMSRYVVNYTLIE